MKQKLELTWIGKDKQPQLEPRILIEDREKSFGDRNSQNMLIHGDNLLALKALEQDFSNKIKSIFIDPPYNTGSAFEHYDDGIEHSLWLSLLRDRLEILKNLLAQDGSLWVSIDDHECHFLKVLLDEIFGRSNFVASVIWEKAYSERMDAKGFSNSHDYILVYRRSDNFKIKLISKEQNKKQFTFYDVKSGKYYRRRSLRKEGSESLRKDRQSMWYPIIAPDGSQVLPIKPDGIEGRWRWKSENVEKYRDQLEYINKDNKWEIYVKQFIDESATRPPNTIWKQEEVGHNHEAKEEVKVFNRDNVFSTPKPERLICRIIELSSEENDIIIDSFLGSGTTAAVAHKMGRKWIGIELGDHCDTHCLPRLKKVVTGEDQGGISKSMGWKGGGGFKYYYLAPSLLQKDKYDNWVIDKTYKPDMLAAAMAKHEGFRFNPDEHVYWKQGQSTEKDFIFTTTTFVTVEYLDKIREDMKPEETLLICCKAFQEPCESRYMNINIKKIPQMLLGRCEFGKEDYSLNIVNVPLENEKESVLSDEPDEERNKVKKSTPRKREKKQDKSSPTLF